MSKHSVYVIGLVFNGQPSKPTKVGVSIGPYGRLSNLQTACPYEMALVHAFEFSDRNSAFDLERTTHEFYRKERMRGEWLNVEPMEVLDFMVFELERRPRSCARADLDQAVSMLAGAA